MSETRRSFRDHPLFQLTKVRFLEFVREPEALFWVFVFPVLLTAGLGLAFRTRAPEQVKLGVLEGPRAAPVIASLEADKRVLVKSLNDSGAAQSLRTGKIAVLVLQLWLVLTTYHAVVPTFFLAAFFTSVLIFSMALWVRERTRGTGPW